LGSTGAISYLVSFSDALGLINIRHLAR